MSDGSVERAIANYARATGKPLSPHWNAELREVELAEGVDALAGLLATLGWEPARRIEGRPRPDQFPLIVHDPASGWAVVQQWDGSDVMALVGERASLPYDPDQRFFTLSLPDPLSSDGDKAISVFWRAIKRRKQPLVMAGLATVFANLLTLATSLYSMQLYDRVIPLASFDTLLVLTAGVLFALTLDLCLRSLRALLIEREAQDIDAEVSEFFFARAQSIRLDARPPGIGTMASQLRGQEQIRQVLSSGSLFMLADLPFALFFIAVIAMIGGPLALVPAVSLPIAIGFALILSRIIRTGTDRAQVSGNRKNGMLVESLDATETVKANRGGWFMMGRWNRLVREIHHYEDPVKRASAIAGSLFSTLQQTAYVALMGWGAYLAANGEITTGALLACSIIAGRINGPLVAQLPNMIVQWGYARSSLKALDQIMRLPLDPASGAGALRPDTMAGSYEVKDAVFVYPGSQRPAVEVESFQLNPGERVAIIGGIGSGKSTLLKLLSGLYSPQQGRVLLGGLDLSQVAEDISRRHIGYVSQDARLVNGTLRDNLAMGLGDVTDEEIMEVARDTKLDAMIATQPNGLSLQIQEGGRGLSGGQRSLVGINRLLLSDPKIWLLDEPTASLDQNTENAALEAIDRELDDDGILVMVTHKPQLLPRFSRIVVMAQGKIVRDGPTKEILGDLSPKKLGDGARGPAKGPPSGMVTTKISNKKAS
ncbi:ATP-binding cassette domain-containing protein [Aurantiacibacter poecillastricola]|uniref:ATP-binding cassette domain-containing protein n=1 Tax=Aurantiacibacter poecillastricola TaxID=3064385 RepID=UPI00273E003C|nr:ATP-binding cassette domain-containing protein [Aurantiacibacter sp. 219JJ12-13]MDP5261402.1 ATP-binding cassette domain-containing protein [Aurantiacibacter sp. 219JJ12-13]